MDTADRAKKLGLNEMVFSPSASVDKLALFAGRTVEIRKISQAINTRGRHAVIYGDRGVGKTSLATVLKEIFADVQQKRFVKTNCNQSDDFRNVWRKTFLDVNLILEPASTKGEGSNSVEIRLADELDQTPHIGPGEIRYLLQKSCDENNELVIAFDEFDKLPAHERAHFADTIKDLSDNSVNSTLLLFGVASNIIELIAEHASIDRCLSQIHMPPMTREELGDILSKAMTALGMIMNEDASEIIILLSQGLPHYTHLLGQEATYEALAHFSNIVTFEHAITSIKQAIQNTLQSIRDNYQKAAEGQRKGTLFPDVLLACALARIDENGYFSSTDVRGPLREITGKDYDIPNFSQHLDKFSSDVARGPVLEKWGTPRRFRFRFRDRLLRPFIVMKGMMEGKLKGDLFGQLIRKSYIESDRKDLFK
jgi:Cdc6-like AAA superfamily ATPase